MRNAKHLIGLVIHMIDGTRQLVLRASKQRAYLADGRILNCDSIYYQYGSGSFYEI